MNTPTSTTQTTKAQTYRKTINCILEITSGNSDYDNCEQVEQVLLGSTLGSSIYSLSVRETKVIERKPL